ncbi:hypothetical protein [Streptomyces sp. DSM 41013]
MLAIRSTYRRRRFIRAAHRLLRNGHLWPSGKTANDITGQDLAGYVADRYGTRISAIDAQGYLDEARAQHHPATEK